jgi:hypothetical protein
MSDIRLTCDETPLAWPPSTSLDDLKVCSTCGIKVHSPQPGSLQILTRRQSKGVGDGVTIDESNSVGADYRGQRYTIEEAIFHTPGLHIFPGQKEVYPAEYHIHMRTMAAPIRYITVVIPVSHLIKSEGIGTEYFKAMRAKPDPAATRPTLDTLLKSPTGAIINTLQYMGPDVRGRTAEVADNNDVCASSKERQFILVLNVCHIRATDLERIPREGSLSTDPRDLPAPGVTPSVAIPSDRLLRSTVYAVPGILENKQVSAIASAPTPTGTELECKPVKVVNGRDVIDVDGKVVDVKKLLGVGEEVSEPHEQSYITTMGKPVTMFIGTFAGLLLADWLIYTFIWAFFFKDSDRLAQWEPIKIWTFLTIALTAAGFSGGILELFGI